MHELTLSILSRDSNGNHILRLNAGPWANHDFAVTPTICCDPTCPCANVRFVRSEQEGKDETKPFRFFSLDARRRCATALSESHSPPTASQFAETVAAELTDSDWLDLLGYLLISKQSIILNANMSTLDIHSLQEMLADTEHLLGYADVFPLTSRFPFQIGSEHWLCKDEYCINPDCECNEALLTFLRIDKDTDLDETAPAVYFDYATSATKPEQLPTMGQPPLELLVSELLRSYNTLPLLLKCHHQQLRLLRLRAHIETKKELIRSAEDRSLEGDYKTGRNDPCPCGSGKKYKKCCGIP